MLGGKQIILGSGSPRRREILETLRIPFVVQVPDVDESVHQGEDADAYLERVALSKLTDVRARLQATPQPMSQGALAGQIILVADTSVVQYGDILGKPASMEHAEDMIRSLAGETHEVKTCFILGDPEPFHAETVTTKVTFRALSDEEIRAYAESGEGMDKAGAYAVQGFAASFVSRIEGSYSNVVGLPACELMVALQRRLAAQAPGPSGP